MTELRVSEDVSDRQVWPAHFGGLTRLKINIKKKLDNDFESKFEDIFDKITEYGKKIHTKTKIKFIFLLQTATILN